MFAPKVWPLRSAPRTSAVLELPRCRYLLQGGEVGAVDHDGVEVSVREESNREGHLLVGVILAAVVELQEMVLKPVPRGNTEKSSKEGGEETRTILYSCRIDCEM